jgi:hypothetical protein
VDSFVLHPPKRNENNAQNILLQEKHQRQTSILGTALFQRSTDVHVTYKHKQTEQRKKARKTQTHIGLHKTEKGMNSLIQRKDCNKVENSIKGGQLIDKLRNY